MQSPLCLPWILTRLIQALGWSDDLASYLQSRPIQIPYLSFLWAQLVFETLDPWLAANQTRSLKRTKKDIDELLGRLPTTIGEGYETALSLTPDAVFLRKALGLIMAAKEPLTISQLNVAMEISEHTELQCLETSRTCRNSTRISSLQKIVRDPYCILGVSHEGSSFVGVLVNIAGRHIGSNESGSFFRRRPIRLHTQLSSLQP
ncbi:hypothetical protein IWX90DRAFT_298201 [Phyllosticta citrichinensis]|uniref:Uncharacterized protein n=1 Tax=Phyllosticta citrichinensis TaxID=1130410 RepID=A0ABR1XKR8_9PEZI